MPNQLAVAFVHGVGDQTPNFFDEDDVIGYPLKTLYPGAILEDERVNAGNLLTSWSPLSHDAYWTDSDVTDKIESELAAFWRMM